MTYADDLYDAITAADEASGGPVRRLRRTARSDAFSQGAAIMLARYQRQKRHPRRVLAEKQAAVDRLKARIGWTDL